MHRDVSVRIAVTAGLSSLQSKLTQINTCVSSSSRIYMYSWKSSSGASKSSAIQ